MIHPTVRSDDLKRYSAKSGFPPISVSKTMTERTLPNPKAQEARIEPSRALATVLQEQRPRLTRAEKKMYNRMSGCGKLMK